MKTLGKMMLWLLGIILFVPLAIVGAYLSIFILMDVFSSATHKPIFWMSQTAEKELGVGSYIFTIVRRDNGSQSNYDAPNIFRVTEIDNDFVFAEDVLDATINSGEDRPNTGITEAKYRSFKNKIKAEKVVAINEDFDLNYSKGIDTLLEMLKKDPTIKIFHGCNPRRVSVFSKQSLLEDGSLEFFIRDAMPEPTKMHYGYVDLLTSHVDAGKSSLCPKYGDTWWGSLRYSIKQD
ncbi:hypothetical protein [Collimonas pratensis]|nr:hypothetical protein [Collimonas pratensis]